MWLENIICFFVLLFGKRKMESSTYMSGSALPAQGISPTLNVSYNAVSRSGSGSSTAPGVASTSLTTQNVSSAAPEIDPRPAYAATPTAATQNVSYNAVPKVVSNASYGVSLPAAWNKAAANSPQPLYEQCDPYYSSTAPNPDSDLASSMVPLTPLPGPKVKVRSPEKKPKRQVFSCCACLVALVLVGCVTISCAAMGLSVWSVYEVRQLMTAADVPASDMNVTRVVNTFETDLSDFRENVTQKIGTFQADLSDLEGRLTDLVGTLQSDVTRLDMLITDLSQN